MDLRKVEKVSYSTIDKLLTELFQFFVQLLCNIEKF